jgi:ABC-type molybdenum transport system ATPase subunit/photorepair protein PhrA
LKTAKNILSVAGLRIVRDGTVILRDVNWRVRREEHWVCRH